MFICFGALHAAALECIAFFEVSKQLQSTGVSTFPKTTCENSRKARPLYLSTSGLVSKVQEFKLMGIEIKASFVDVQ